MMLLGERLSAEEARADGHREQGRPGRRVRRGRGRLGGQARLQVAGAEQARQGRDLQADGHGLRRGARLPALAAVDRLHHRGRPGGRAARSSRRGSPSGRVGEPGRAALPHVRPQRRPGARRRGAGAAPGRAPRRRAAPDRLARARRARRPTRTTCATPAAACSRPAVRSTTRSPAATCPVLLAGRLLDLPHHAAHGAPPPARGQGALARRARRLQHARDDPERLPRRHGLAGACRQWDAGHRRRHPRQPGRARGRPRARPWRARAARALARRP